MDLHILNQITVSLLKLIQLADMAEYTSLSLSLSCSHLLYAFKSDFWLFVCCSTMKSLAKELQRQCINSDPYVTFKFQEHPFRIFPQIELFVVLHSICSIPVSDFSSFGSFCKFFSVVI